MTTAWIVISVIGGLVIVFGFIIWLLHQRQLNYWYDIVETIFDETTTVNISQLSELEYSQIKSDVRDTLSSNLMVDLHKIKQDTLGPRPSGCFYLYIQTNSGGTLSWVYDSDTEKILDEFIRFEQNQICFFPGKYKKKLHFVAEEAYTLWKLGQ